MESKKEESEKDGDNFDAIYTVSKKMKIKKFPYFQRMRKKILKMSKMKQ